eukprot:3992685-Alexandrium_andersonii.AAC.1
MSSTTPSSAPPASACRSGAAAFISARLRCVLRASASTTRSSRTSCARRVSSPSSDWSCWTP